MRDERERPAHPTPQAPPREPTRRQATPREPLTQPDRNVPQPPPQEGKPPPGKPDIETRSL